MSFPCSLDIIVYSGAWQANYPTLKMINANRKNDDSLIIFFYVKSFYLSSLQKIISSTVRSMHCGDSRVLKFLSTLSSVSTGYHLYVADNSSNTVLRLIQGTRTVGGISDSRTKDSSTFAAVCAELNPRDRKR